MHAWAYWTCFHSWKLHNVQFGEQPAKKWMKNISKTATRHKHHQQKSFSLIFSESGRSPMNGRVACENDTKQNFYEFYCLTENDFNKKKKVWVLLNASLQNRKDSQYDFFRSLSLPKNSHIHHTYTHRHTYMHIRTHTHTCIQIKNNLIERKSGRKIKK